MRLCDLVLACSIKEMLSMICTPFGNLGDNRETITSMTGKQHVATYKLIMHKHGFDSLDESNFFSCQVCTVSTTISSFRPHKFCITLPWARLMSCCASPKLETLRSCVSFFSSVCAVSDRETNHVWSLMRAPRGRLVKRVVSLQEIFSPTVHIYRRVPTF
ncbi:Uncharacterized protein HZ326_23308 [Fusarium oxysporum f. sp. albedinis]|nr:Uncharacterized protein HZ326_23308 [Fusarium oxysporum f. sp. albedinis]